MNILIVVLLVVFGIVLLLAELFLIPGFGIAGIAGIASLIGAVAFAYIKISVLAGNLSLLLSVVMIAVTTYIFLRGRTLDKMALDAKIDSSVGLADPGKKIGKLEKDAAKLEADEQ